MKKNGLKNERGITLVMLIITIIIIALLLGIAVSNIDIGHDIRNYNYMKADIELLEAKIMTYYNENNKTLPTTGEVISPVPELGGQKSPRDNDNYYRIDIQKLYNITLNYGGGTLAEGDIYIVNEQSHNVYYLKGVLYEGYTYYAPRGTPESEPEIGDGGGETEENNAPVLSAYDYKETADAKTTEKFTIAMRATDDDAVDTLTYTLKASTSQNGTYYTIDTATGTSGETKTIPVTAINGNNLTEYTQYWWYVEVTDGTETVQSEAKSLRTYCSGKGNGTATYQCIDDGTTECSICGGSGVRTVEHDIYEFEGTMQHWMPDGHTICYGNYWGWQCVGEGCVGAHRWETCDCGELTTDYGQDCIDTVECPTEETWSIWGYKCNVCSYTTTDSNSANHNTCWCLHSKSEPHDD